MCIKLRQKLIGSFSLTVLACAALAACGKKTVTDPGPQFSMEAANFHINGASTSGIVLKRDEPNFGPLIHIDTEKPESVNYVDKSVTCGTLKISAPRRLARDSGMLSFRFADDEFPGISKLPSYTSCILSVLVSNNLGSTATKNQALFFTFDKGPGIELEQTVGFAASINGPNNDGEIPIETYKIRNTLSYTVRIRFSPLKVFEYATCYQYHPPAYAEARTISGCNRDGARAAANSLRIDGKYQNLEEDAPRTLVFTLEPNDWARVSSAFRLPAAEATPLPALKLFMDPNTPYTRILEGIYISGFLNFDQDPLTLESTLPLTSQRDPNTPPESLHPLRQSAFQTVRKVKRPDFLPTR